MPPDATDTRRRLIRAAERVFADRGVDNATVREILAAAEVSNSSALQYHFGSRDQLVSLVFAQHAARIDEHRVPLVAVLRAQPDPATIEQLVGAVVLPLSEQLRTDSGRDCLRAIVHMRERSGLRAGGKLGGPVSAELIWIHEQLDDRLAHLAGPVRRERVAAWSDMVVAALGGRAAYPIDPSAFRLGVDDFATNLIDMGTAALRSPCRLA
ncbi:TetR/AcrR family transcriptional regulator [Nocardiaceae bacterium NPDC056970]